MRGIDADGCRSIAAVIFGDPSKVNRSRPSVCLNSSKNLAPVTADLIPLVW
jgi:hypothetical protein